MITIIKFTTYCFVGIAGWLGFDEPLMIPLFIIIAYLDDLKPGF